VFTSTLQQVFENTESTARQYALRERALALGWADERIVVIDQDLGHSAASTADRLGFQRLVASVGLGQGLCCKNQREKKKDTKESSRSAYAASPNTLLTTATWSKISPFAAPAICPFLIMFIISYPCKVRQAVSKEKKPNPGFTRRLMCAMVLLDQIVEVLDLTQFTAFRDHPLGFELAFGLLDRLHFCRR
jgi:hypothetical protein